MDLTGWSFYSTDFKGEDVKMELRPLFIPEFRLIAPYMREMSDLKTAGKIEELGDKALEMISKCENIFKDHVRNIEGVYCEGAALSPDILSKDVRLSILSQKIIQELFMRSQIMEAEGKNSGTPSTSGAG